jgi:hypothetical protein
VIGEPGRSLRHVRIDPAFIWPALLLAPARWWRVLLGAALVRMRFLSNVLAELTIVPLIVTWATWRPRELRKASLRRFAEIAAVYAGC